MGKYFTGEKKEHGIANLNPCPSPQLVEEMADECFWAVASHVYGRASRISKALRHRETRNPLGVMEAFNGPAGRAAQKVWRHHHGSYEEVKTENQVNDTSKNNRPKKKSFIEKDKTKSRHRKEQKSIRTTHARDTFFGSDSE